MSATQKFTKGEWFGPHFAKSSVRCNCGYIFSDAQRGMGAICEVFFDDGTDPENETRETAEANAHLIVSAPSLYKALSAVLDDFHSGENSAFEIFEREAAEFQAETGLLAPGKDSPANANEPEEHKHERAERWREWQRAKHQAVLAAAVAALRKARGEK